MLRAAEWIHLTYFMLMAVLALGLRVPRGQQTRALGLAALGIAVTLSAILSPSFLPPDLASDLRSWIPAPLVLVAYWQAGSLYTGPNHRIEGWLRKIDTASSKTLEPLDRVLEWRWFVRYLEVSYLVAYPFIPLSLAALYLGGNEADADRFWAVVLTATYFCYLALPLAPTRPPRLVGQQDDVLRERATERAEGRLLNLWILDRLGIGVNTFPSGHVAATTAASLVVFEQMPSSGIFFLAVAAGIALAVVVRRYHYLVDAILGIAVGFLAWWWI